MNTVAFLASINKIAIGAFIITLGFLFYEAVLFIKQRKSSLKPTVPNFQEGKQYGKVEVATLPDLSPSNKGVSPLILKILVLILAAVGFGLVIYLGARVLSVTSSQSSSTSVTPSIVQVATSEGIKVYSLNWQLIPDEKLILLKGGDNIYIGIKSISGVAVDKARIRVNQNEWTITDETTDFNNEQEVYFTKYQIATGEAQLKIEAQLHSATEGWLGE